MLKPKLAIIGGSGLCEFPELITQKIIKPRTIYGYPSDRIHIGYLDKKLGKEMLVAFIPRHGAKHHLPPHKIPYKANIAALKKLGVQTIIGTCIVGSLKKKIKPGDFLIPDQFVNLTWGRDDNFDIEHSFIHLPLADPYCSRLRKKIIDKSLDEGVVTHRSGTVAVIQGPRFSTKAESRWFKNQGWDVVNMTQYPECIFAREFKICYAAIAMVTDYDVGLEKTNFRFDKHSIGNILKIFKNNIIKVRSLLIDIILESNAVSNKCKCCDDVSEMYENLC